MFGIVVASFVTAMVVTQWQLISVGRTSLEIADSTAPSIEYLANARGEMRHLEVVLHDYVEERGTQPARVAAAEKSRHALEEAIDQYLQLPVEPAEQRLWGNILRTNDELNASVDRCLAAANAHDWVAAANALAALDSAADALGTAITRDIELNAARSHALALAIVADHDRSTVLAFALAGLCVAITAVGAFGLRRAMRRTLELADEHQRLVEVRASELEQFAGRVAHDILSPLSVVGLALRTSGSEAMRAQMIGRATSAIKRIDRLVSGLLAFAVAGAEPQEDAHADVEVPSPISSTSSARRPPPPARSCAST